MRKVIVSEFVFFRDRSHTSLKLVEAKAFSSRIVLLRYQVVKEKSS